MPPGANGVVNEQVVAVIEYRDPTFTLRVSAVTCSDPVPELVIVITLVTAARGVGMVNVKVRTPKTVASVAFVALVKLSVPCPPPPPPAAPHPPPGAAPNSTAPTSTEL